MSAGTTETLIPDGAGDEERGMAQIEEFLDRVSRQDTHNLYVKYKVLPREDSTPDFDVDAESPKKQPGRVLYEDPEYQKAAYTRPPMYRMGGMAIEGARLPDRRRNMASYTSRVLRVVPGGSRERS